MSGVKRSNYISVFHSGHISTFQLTFCWHKYFRNGTNASGAKHAKTLSRMHVYLYTWNIPNLGKSTRVVCRQKHSIPYKGTPMYYNEDRPIMKSCWFAKNTIAATINIDHMTIDVLALIQCLLLPIENSWQGATKI